MSKLNRQMDIKRRMESAVFPLVGDPRFQDFMELMAQLKDEAIEFACSHDAVTSSRATLAALGEVRTYRNILSIYENQKVEADERANQLDEQQEG